MCDYSLFAVPNRLAKENEDLVAYRFPTGSMGLAVPAEVNRVVTAARQRSQTGIWAAVRNFFTMPNSEPVTAVCIPPGARLRLQDIPHQVQQDYGVGPVEEVTFVQTSANVNAYRDAVQFSNGYEMHLQELRVGQRVRVLNLGSAETAQEDLILREPLYRA